MVGASGREEEHLAALRERQRADADLCSMLIGMSLSAVTEFVEQRGYHVRSAVIGSDAVFTADMDTSRVNLFLSSEGVVVRADVG